jgi:hypothetical protein
VMILAVAIAALCAASSPRQDPRPAPPPVAPASTPPPARISISPAPDRGASAIEITSPLLPGERLALMTCEAVLDGGQDFGIHTVKPEAKDWQSRDGTCSYTWSVPPGLRLSFSATPESDSVRLEYVLTNSTEKSLACAHLHPCLPTLGAPSFYPGTVEQAEPGPKGRAARLSRKDYSELYTRLFLWSHGERFSFHDTQLGSKEVHLAFPAQGQPLVRWNWWKNGERTFDVPLIALSSQDGKRVLAIAFERALWASSNVGDARACLHLFPLLGRIEPGGSRTVVGRIYVLEGGPEAALARFRKDFPAASPR